MAPALVPATHAGSQPCSSSTASAPTSPMPLTPPPSRTRSTGCELIRAWRELRGAPPVGAPQPRPLVRVVAVLVHVPVGAARVPDRPRERRPQLAVELVGDLRLDLDPLRVRPLELLQARQHVAHAGLDRVD